MNSFNYCLLPVFLSIIYYPLLITNEWNFLLTWDDRVNFVDNALIKSLSFHNIKLMFTRELINVWEPLGWFSKALIYQMIGLNSRKYRIVALILHTFNLWLQIASLLRELLDTQYEESVLVWAVNTHSIEYTTYI